jgi:large subunit ribosomal protein L24
MKRIKKGDEVIVTTGRSKGQRGHVLRIMGEDRLLVENVNMLKKHQKPNPSMQQPGGIVDKEGPIHVSNVRLYNPMTGKADGVSFKNLEDGRKVRVYRSTGEVVDV